MDQPTALKNAAEKPRRSSRPSQWPADVVAARDRRIETTPKHLRGLFRKAWAGKSRKSAIRAMCVECMGYQRADVERCTSLACPLYGYRLTRSAGEPQPKEGEGGS